MFEFLKAAYNFVIWVLAMEIRDALILNRSWCQSVVHIQSYTTRNSNGQSLKYPMGPNQPKYQILFHKRSPTQGFIIRTLDLNWQYLLHVTLNFCGNCIKVRRYYVWPIVLHSLYVTLQLTCNISCKVQRYFFDGTTLKWFC